MSTRFYLTVKVQGSKGPTSNRAKYASFFPGGSASSDYPDLGLMLARTIDTDVIADPDEQAACVAMLDALDATVRAQSDIAAIHDAVPLDVAKIAALLDTAKVNHAWLSAKLSTAEVLALLDKEASVRQLQLRSDGATLEITAATAALATASQELADLKQAAEAKP